MPSAAAANSPSRFAPVVSRDLLAVSNALPVDPFQSFLRPLDGRVSPFLGGSVDVVVLGDVHRERPRLLGNLLHNVGEYFTGIAFSCLCSHS